jgi:hypothetical protein
LSEKELEKELLKQIPKAFKIPHLDSEDLMLRVAELRLRVEELKAQTYKPFSFTVEPISPLAMIHAKYVALMSSGSNSDLVCPSCGGVDEGNKVNGKPWCLKCNTMLVQRGKLKKWMKKAIKVLSKNDALKKDLERLYPGGI